MSQKERLLNLLKESPNGVTCGHLATQGLYHSAAKRVFDLKGNGHSIDFIQGETWDQSKYVLRQFVGKQGMLNVWIGA